MPPPPPPCTRQAPRGQKLKSNFIIFSARGHKPFSRRPPAPPLQTDPGATLVQEAQAAFSTRYSQGGTRWQEAWSHSGTLLPEAFPPAHTQTWVSPSPRTRPVYKLRTPPSPVAPPPPPPPRHASSQIGVPIASWWRAAHSMVSVAPFQAETRDVQCGTLCCVGATSAVSRLQEQVHCTPCGTEAGAVTSTTRRQKRGGTGSDA